jgi:hypothetical protein
MLPDILDRHFAILEEPDPDEDPIVVDVSRPVEDIVAEVLRGLAPEVPENRRLWWPAIVPSGVPNRLSSRAGRIRIQALRRYRGVGAS